MAKLLHEQIRRVVCSPGGFQTGVRNSSSVASQLTSGVTQIFSTDYAFAALKSNGSVVTWGDSSYGGDSSSVASQLTSGVVSFADPFNDDRLVLSTSESSVTLALSPSSVTEDGSSNLVYTFTRTGDTANTLKPLFMLLHRFVQSPVFVS